MPLDIMSAIIAQWAYGGNVHDLLAIPLDCAIPASVPVPINDHPDYGTCLWWAPFTHPVTGEPWMNGPHWECYLLGQGWVYS